MGHLRPEHPPGRHTPAGPAGAAMWAGPTQLTYHVGAHHGQRRQVGGAEGREPACVHLGDPRAPKQLVLEEQADLGGGDGVGVSGPALPPPSAS